MKRDTAVYETIGRSYTATRREDPRIAAHIHAALGDARRIINIGAGSGNYEPRDRFVASVEPSPTMLLQRLYRSGRETRGIAEHLPFRDGAFDAALAVLTVHHWRDRAAGLQEMKRMAPRQVIFLFEPAMTDRFWAMDYFPEAIELPSEADAPGIDAISRHLDLREVRVVPVPRDCTDGFGAAYWARPERYLEPEVQAGMSWLAQLPDEVRARGTAALREDLESGRWRERHGHLLDLDEYDSGYRIAICGG
jgi:SAM-dependent methyltransferase